MPQIDYGFSWHEEKKVFPFNNWELRISILCYYCYFSFGPDPYS